PAHDHGRHAEEKAAGAQSDNYDVPGPARLIKAGEIEAMQAVIQPPDAAASGRLALDHGAVARGEVQPTAGSICILDAQYRQRPLGGPIVVVAVVRRQPFNVPGV